MTQKPNYFSIITADVRYDKDLSPNAKLLYSEITALSNQNGKCNANDSYFANLYNTTKRSIQNWLTQLEDKGYIEREIIFKDGTQEVLKRTIILSLRPSEKNFTTPYGKKIHYPSENNCIDNNNTTYSNNIKNKNINIFTKKKIIFDEIEDGDWEKLFAYWVQEKAGTKYTPENRKYMLEKLKQLSDNDFLVALEAIKHAAANKYQGFFNSRGLFYDLRKTELIPVNTKTYKHQEKKVVW